MATGLWVSLVSGLFEKQYCKQNGWLKPEIASITHMFNELRAKGQELCNTQYSKYGVERFTMAMPAGHWPIDVKTAENFAAWTCAMGDVACDIAYCNYVYCERDDGTV